MDQGLYPQGSNYAQPANTLYVHDYDQWGQIDEKMEKVQGDISDIKINHAQLVAEVDRATQPRHIFEVDERYTGPRGGYCLGFNRCVIDVRMRRTPEGAMCDFLPGRDRYFASCAARKS